MIKPGSPEWHRNVVRLREEEASQPLIWWWLSFGSPEGWRGGCLVMARGITTALDEANRYAINPGGQVKAFPIGPDQPDLPVNRLLSKADINADGGAVRF